MFNRNGHLCKCKLSKTQCLTVILHDQKDVVVPSFQGQYLYNHINGPRLCMISNGRHALPIELQIKTQRLVKALLIDSKLMPWDDL